MKNDSSKPDIFLLAMRLSQILEKGQPEDAETRAMAASFLQNFLQLKLIYSWSTMNGPSDLQKAAQSTGQSQDDLIKLLAKCQTPFSDFYKPFRQLINDSSYFREEAEKLQSRIPELKSFTERVGILPQNHHLQ